jgi:hypothetical protein
MDALDLATPRGLSGAFEVAIEGVRRRMQHIDRMDGNGDIFHDTPSKHPESQRAANHCDLGIEKR